MLRAQEVDVEEETSPKVGAPNTYLQLFVVSLFCLKKRAEGVGNDTNCTRSAIVLT